MERERMRAEEGAVEVEGIWPTWEREGGVRKEREAEEVAATTRLPVGNQCRAVGGVRLVVVVEGGACGWCEAHTRSTRWVQARTRISGAMVCVRAARRRGTDACGAGGRNR